jgi:hypothetical protein
MLHGKRASQRASTPAFTIAQLRHDRSRDRTEVPNLAVTEPCFASGAISNFHCRPKNSCEICHDCLVIRVRRSVPQARLQVLGGNQDRDFAHSRRHGVREHQLVPAPPAVFDHLPDSPHLALNLGQPRCNWLFFLGRPLEENPVFPDFIIHLHRTQGYISLGV